MVSNKVVACGQCQGAGFVSAKAKCPYCGQAITIDNMVNPYLNSDTNEGKMQFAFHCPSPSCGMKIILGLQEVNQKIPCPTCSGSGRSASFT